MSLLEAEQPQWGAITSNNTHRRKHDKTDMTAMAHTNVVDEYYFFLDVGKLEELL